MGLGPGAQRSTVLLQRVLQAGRLAFTLSRSKVAAFFIDWVMARASTLLMSACAAPRKAWGQPSEQLLAPSGAANPSV